MNPVPAFITAFFLGYFLGWIGGKQALLEELHDPTWEDVQREVAPYQ